MKNLPTITRETFTEWITEVFGSVPGVSKVTMSDPTHTCCKVTIQGEHGQMSLVAGMMTPRHPRFPVSHVFVALTYDGTMHLPMQQMCSPLVLVDAMGDVQDLAGAIVRGVIEPGWGYLATAAQLDEEARRSQRDNAPIA